jgi:hypothetical protein
MPEVFVAKGRDGKTDIWGIITRPTNFEKYGSGVGPREIVAQFGDDSVRRGGKGP